MSSSLPHGQASYTPDGHIVINGASGDAPIPTEPSWSMVAEVEDLLRQLPEDAPTIDEPVAASEVVKPVVKRVSKPSKIAVTLAAMRSNIQQSATELVWCGVDDIQTAGRKLQATAAKAVDNVHVASKKLQVSTAKAVLESARQYQLSAEDGQRLGANLYDESRTLLGHFWFFLRQPVWVARKNRTARQSSRGALFLNDVLRFGTTFALIFGTLFIGLNYESFWQIAAAELDPLSHVPELQAQIPTLASHLQGRDQKGHEDDLNVVPPVGPPENLLIVPKLGLNVPIVEPSEAPLINQDWTGLENEIQASLQDGVVHYPGTARPGQAGNFFVTGHSSYYAWAPGKFKSVFARLSDLKVGDEYWVYYGGDKHRYKIVSSTEVRPSEVHVLDQPTDQRLATLMTCTPVGTTLRRLIISAVEIDPISGEQLAVGEHGTQEALPKVQVEVLPI